MIAIDTDSGPKTVAELREVARATRMPLVVKGIMTPEQALKAGEAGAKGIVVSNHGGRRIDHTPGTAEVLPAIADKVKGKLVILADGCVHYGIDVFKYVAPGADAVLVAAIWGAAFGGGREHPLHAHDARRVGDCDGGDRCCNRAGHQSEEPQLTE
jgi:isopentenyl diphosphate isomerase/L-lactate dehydrogenase-like FMN-dependent dehydrogenase